MYLKSNTKQEIQSQNEKIEINSGEKILTEISRKFSDSAIIEIFEKSKLKIVKDFRDEKNYYSLYLLSSL